MNSLQKQKEIFTTHARDLLSFKITLEDLIALESLANSHKKAILEKPKLATKPAILNNIQQILGAMKDIMNYLISNGTSMFKTLPLEFQYSLIKDLLQINNSILSELEKFIAEYKLDI